MFINQSDKREFFTNFRVLYELAKMFSKDKIRWLFAGSTASFLNGLDVEPRDIDILIAKNDVEKVKQILSKHYQVIKPIEYSETDLFASFFGKYRKENVLIEIIGNFKIKYEDGIFYVPFDILQQYSVKKQLKDVEVIAVPLEWQLVANAMIPNKKDRVYKIVNHLKEKGLNINALKAFLEYAPDSIKVRIKDTLMIDNL